MEIKLRSNEFWGERAGYFDPTKNRNTGLENGYRIDLTKWGQGRENKEPCGKKARKTKDYRNLKLKYKNYS